MAHHITINGRPLCDHIDDWGVDATVEAVAGDVDVDAHVCQHAWKESAEEVARVWRAFNGLRAAVKPGPCPSLARRLASQKRD